MDISKVGKELRHPERILQHLGRKPFIFIDKHCNYGTNVFEREWHLLVVLDVCRYDLFLEFAPQHPVFERFSAVERTYSVASQSLDWIHRTFGSKDDPLLARTEYISDTDHTGMVEETGLHGIVSVEPNDDNSAGETKIESF